MFINHINLDIIEVVSEKTMVKYMQDFEQLFTIAQMYYEQDLTQEEISKKLFISRSNISRLLKQAKDAGIVEVNVHYPFERKRRYESEFKRRYGIEDICIVDLSDSSGFELYAQTTKKAASYLNAKLNNNSIVALSCGNSLCGVVHELHPKKYLPNMQVVPLMGSIETPEPILDSFYMVRQMADVYKCKSQMIMSPFRVDDEKMCSNLMKRPAIVEALTTAENATIMVTGIGAKKQVGYLAKEEANEFFSSGAVGYIVGYYFDKNGVVIDKPKYYNKLICASRKMFEIPERMAVVADPNKAEATLAALKGKLINCLVTNNIVANKILEADKDNEIKESSKV